MLAVLPGLDESSYLNDGYSMKDDIVAEIDRKTSHENVGKVLGAWVDFVANSDDSATMVVQPKASSVRYLVYIGPHQGWVAARAAYWLSKRK